MKLEQQTSTPQDQIESRCVEEFKPIEFPTSRYFQIHFEYLDSQIDEVRRMLQELQLQLREVTQHLAKDATRVRNREARPLRVDTEPRKSPRLKNAAGAKPAPPRS